MASRPRLFRHPTATLALSVALVLALSPGAGGTSKTRIAAIGDAAPGGGLFAGPGFVGWPTAAGNGWIAFRGQITGGASTEAIVVAHMTPPVTRTQVASLSQKTPTSDGHAACAGKLKQFIGHPVVNAGGDVAFGALIQPPPGSPQASADYTGPLPAGLFVLRGGQLAPIACSGDQVAGHVLDLTAVLDLFSDPNVDVADRSPALNDTGDVAFLTGYVTAQGFPDGGAILLAPSSGGLTQLVRIDDPFAGGKLQTLGPPALNNHGMIIFHALSTTTDPNEPDGLVDGVFAVDATGLNFRVLVQDGITPPPANQTLTEFEDAVSLDDAGDFAFLAGPIFDNSADANPSDLGSPGVIVSMGGVVSVLGYPGQVIGPDKVSGVALGPLGGGATAAPSIAPDGSVTFFASLNGGNAEVIARSSGTEVLPVVYTGGRGADASPVGGSYGGAESAPSSDAAGGFVFLARIVGGQSSEAIVYRAANGQLSPIVLGEAAPQQNQGFFGGRPFSAPRLNDAGDVVFRAYVARGPASVGIFRARTTAIDPERGIPLEPVVRAGDASPAPGAPAFLDFAGNPSLNQAGAVAFAAQLPTFGRGIFVADSSGLRAVVKRMDPAPGQPGTIFSGLGPNPQINGAGSVAFRGTTSYRDPVTGISAKQDGIFVADAAGIHALVYGHQPSPTGMPFFKLRDPLLTDAGSIVFRAPLGDTEEVSSGIFTADTTGTTALAVAQQPLGGGLYLTSFSGNPSVTANGGVAFLATLSKPISVDDPALAPVGPAILMGPGLTSVVARGMAGPAGGTFNNLTAPALNSEGHVVFRGTFAALTGGTSGLFLAGSGGIAPYLLRGEVSPLSGHFSAIGSEPSLNADDELAFSATVSGGKARSALFLASPTVLTPGALVLRLTGGRGRDRIALKLGFTLGRVSNGVRPAKEPVTLTLSDTNGMLWKAAIPKKQLVGGGRSFGIAPGRRSQLGRDLRSLRLRVARNGALRLSAVSAPVDLLRGGLRALQPPFTITVEVGDDSGTVAVPCTLGPSGGRCV